jgi:hypothetical protein
MTLRSSPSFSPSRRGDGAASADNDLKVGRAVPIRAPRGRDRLIHSIAARFENSSRLAVVVLASGRRESLASGMVGSGSRVCCVV